MIRTKNTYLALLAVLVSPVAANADLIDFDTDADGEAIGANVNITSQYASLGVNFIALENSDVALAWTKNSLDGGAPPSSPNGWSNCGSGAGATSCGGQRADILRAVFDFDVMSVSWLLDSLGSRSVAFEAYDAVGILLEVVSNVGDTGGYDPFSFSVSGIRRIDIVQPTDSWGYIIDNLAFTRTAVPVAVPEPGTLALFGIGLLGMGLARRKKRI